MNSMAYVYYNSTSGDHWLNNFKSNLACFFSSWENLEFLSDRKTHLTMTQQGIKPQTSWLLCFISTNTTTLSTWSRPQHSKRNEAAVTFTYGRKSTILHPPYYGKISAVMGKQRQLCQSSIYLTFITNHYAKTTWSSTGAAGWDVCVSLGWRRIKTFFKDQSWWSKQKKKKWDYDHWCRVVTFAVS